MTGAMTKSVGSSKCSLRDAKVTALPDADTYYTGALSSLRKPGTPGVTRVELARSEAER